MFKLIKINGARTNVPEPILVTAKNNETYIAGAVYYLCEGGISTSPASEVDLKFIPLETVTADSGKKKVCGYIVSEGMVFETDIYNDFNNAKVGNSLMFYADGDGNFIGVDSEAGYDALLLSKDEAKTKRKVLVALKW